MKKPRGQLSIDLVLTIFIILIFIAGFQSISSSLIESQQELSVKQQEKIILLDLKQLIESSAKGTTLISNYLIPEIKINGKSLQNCDLTIKSDLISITAKNDDESISEMQTEDFSQNYVSLAEQTIKCGNKITLQVDKS